MAMLTEPMQPGGPPPPPMLLRFGVSQLEEYTARLCKLRDDIVAGVHPKYKVPPSFAGGKGKLPAATNDLQRREAASRVLHPSKHDLPVKPAQPGQSKLFPVQDVQSATQVQPNLTTSTDSQFLFKEQSRQKRLDLEKALEEQVRQKRGLIKQRTFEQDAWPDFDVDEVLRKAKTVVRPFPVVKEDSQNIASSADSFDNNTFYSSQMNDRSPVLESGEQKRSQNGVRKCNFYVKGKPCPYGDGCIFQHEDALEHTAQGEKAANQSPVARQPAEAPNVPPRAPLPAEISQQERIEQLEAELRAIKAAKQSSLVGQASNEIRENFEPQEDSVYSPPGPDEFGRDVSLRELPTRTDQTSPRAVNASGSEISRRVGETNPGHFVHNHIRSPLAPQPSRVSPMAVNKLSHITPPEPRSGPNSAPRADDGASSAKAQKRKRGAMRNTDGGPHKILRREEGSPEIRIKEEPLSPPSQPARLRRLPLAPEYGAADETLSINASRRRQAPVPRPVSYFEVDEPPASTQSVQRLSDVPAYTQLMQRLPSRNEARYVGEDPSLRRVVSERHLRAPPTVVRYEHDQSYDRRNERAASQVYAPSHVQGYGERQNSLRPQTGTYSPSRPHIMTPRATRASPAPPHTVAMAPPPRRIYVDQYGNRIMADGERQVSLAPSHRQRSSFEQAPAPRPIAVHEPMYEHQQIQLQDWDPQARMSQTSPRYQDTRSNLGPVEPEYDDVYDPRQPARAVYRAESRPVFQDEAAPGRREANVRMQSVRPLGDRYEIASTYDQFPRAPSVRPVQYSHPPEIVQLSYGANGHASDVRYVEEERPVGSSYHYGSAMPEQRYATEAVDEGLYFQGPRRVQRM